VATVAALTTIRHPPLVVAIGRSSRRSSTLWKTRIVAVSWEPERKQPLLKVGQPARPPCWWSGHPATPPRPNRRWPFPSGPRC